MADPARLPATLTRAAIEQIQERPFYMRLTYGDGNVIDVRTVSLTVAERDALCVLALRGLERPTCATCMWQRKNPISDPIDLPHCGNGRSPAYQGYTPDEFGCLLHEPKPVEVIP